MEALASAVIPYSKRSPPAIPPAVLMSTASSRVPTPDPGNMIRMGDLWKRSLIRVPPPNDPNTTRPTPLARCKSLSDGFRWHPTDKPGGRGSSRKSYDGTASNIGSSANLWPQGGQHRCEAQLVTAQLRMSRARVEFLRGRDQSFR